MKKVIFTLMIALAIVSCSDDDTNLLNSNETQTTLSTDKSKSTNLKSEITYIPHENLEVGLEEYILELSEQYSNEVRLINLTLNEVTSNYEVTNEPSPTTTNNNGDTERVVCRGEFHAVERCLSLRIRFTATTGCVFDTNTHLVYDTPPVGQLNGSDVYEARANCD